MFVVVNFDALAQASDFQIHTYIKFLVWFSIAQSVCQRAFSLLEIRFQRPWVRILHSAEEDNLCPFYVSSLSTLPKISHNSQYSQFPGRRQAIIWTNARILLIRPLGTNFSENLIGIQTFSLLMPLKMSSAKWRPLCLGLNVLKQHHTEERTKWRLHGAWDDDIKMWNWFMYYKTMNNEINVGDRLKYSNISDVNFWPFHIGSCWTCGVGVCATGIPSAI